jgi:hypothetical protein
MDVSANESVYIHSEWGPVSSKLELNGHHYVTRFDVILYHITDPLTEVDYEMWELGF